MGYLSLAEVDKGVRDVLKADHLFDCKPAMLRAFNAVKDTAPSHTPHSDDYVTRSEFRLLMVACARCSSCGTCSNSWTRVTTAVWTRTSSRRLCRCSRSGSEDFGPCGNVQGGRQE